ncbi:MAG: TlpA family protein disulfide reductase [Candidatus Nitrospinota bacterium M3_3B_026]
MNAMRESAVFDAAGDAREDSGPRVSVSGRLNTAILLAALAFALNAIYNYSVASRNQYNEMLKVGDKLPSFSLTLVNGKEISGDDFLGKPTAYFFYADWCPCSHYSVNWIEKSREDSRYSGLNMVGVGIQDSSANLKSFAERYRLGFPMSHEGGEAMARNIGVKVTPTTIFTDSEGVIRHIFVGKIEQYEQLTEGLEAILPTDGAKAASGG